MWFHGRLIDLNRAVRRAGHQKFHAMGEIAPEWIKGKINSSDLLTKVVKKDVVDALLTEDSARTRADRRHHYKEC